MTKQDRYKAVIDYFSEAMPVAETELNYGSPYELLLAVVLSAQCTDKRVNMVTPEFFLTYPHPQDLAKATPQEVFEIIKSISYPNNKSKHLVNLAKKLVEDYSGEVPSTREELMTLPGVGRKTANVICSVIFNQPTMAVDTHVFRVSNRIGLTYRAKTPLQVEIELTKHIPDNLIPKAHHWLILHGRYVCLARKPKCEECGIKDVCRFYSTKQKRASKGDAKRKE
ncbi:endonuclease III [Falsiporphyromonas endometrii]|uniref:Endonuclease III n=1 Tax=Falsiporphyromonas endometrii TaxID=1387297 RepID=A0ABV9K8I8_9PORP